MALAVALLMGCTSCTSVTDSGSTLKGWGFASDTTAILFYELWESTERTNIPVNSSGTDYYGWELKLVDVRFHKIYWAAKIDYSRHNTQVLVGRQWNDSTIIIDIDGDGYWLWTVGNKKPQKANFNWNVEMENYKTGGVLSHLSGFRIRPWKKDSVLLFSDSKQISIDTKTMTVNSWYPIGENAWITSCDDFWWSKNEGVCLINNRPDGFTLLSEKGDFLNNFIYTPECANYYNGNCYINNSFWHHFILISLGRCEMNVCNTCPAKKKVCGASYAFIRYDDDLNIDRGPLFWEFGAGIFMDSLENITRY